MKDIVERFRVYDQPRRPEGKSEEWLAGERVDTRGEYYGTAVDVLRVVEDARYRLSYVWENLCPYGSLGSHILYSTESHLADTDSCHFGPAL